MIARLLVLAAAVVAVVIGVTHLRRFDRCTDARTAFVYDTFHRGHRADIPAQVRTIVDACRDPRQLELVATVLVAFGHHPLALTVAHRAIALAPRFEAGWVALAQAQDRFDPAAAARARARVAVLDPRAVVPAAPSPSSLGQGPARAAAAAG